MGIKKLYKENFGTKVFLLFTLFFFVIFSLLTLFHINHHSDYFHNTLLNDGSLMAKVLAYNTRIGVFSENEAMLDIPVESLFQREEVSEVSIFNAHGKLLKKKTRKEDAIKYIDKKLNDDEKIRTLIELKNPFHIENPTTVEFWGPVTSSPAYQMKESPYFEESALIGKRKLIGLVKIELSKKNHLKQKHDALIKSIIIGLLFFIFGLFVIYLLTKRTLGPLKRLTEEINILGAGEIPEKVHIDSPNEFGKLARSFNDMTESLEARKKALKESEQKYRSLFEDSRDAIFIINHEGDFIDANRAAYNLFGFSRESLMKMNFSRLFVSSLSFSSLRYGLELNGYIRETEIKILNKNNDRIECLLTMSPQKGKGDEIIGFQGIIRDVTERKKLEAQVIRSQKLEAIGTLSGGIAHDFNNILGIIVSNTELAIDDIPKKNKVQTNLHEIHRACVRARDLVKQILSLSRNETRVRGNINFGIIIKEALKFLRASFPTTIEMQQDINASNDMIKADPGQVNQMFISLCTNAAYAMREKGGLLDVVLDNMSISGKNTQSLYNLPPGDYVRLMISDTGKGIPDDIIERIFDPYFTTKRPGEGSGMGLAVVYRIIKNHDGNIIIQSAPKKGTIIEVLLPVINETNEVNYNSLESLPGGNEKILLVDDEESMIIALKPILERLGYYVDAKSNSIEALEVFKGNPEIYDLLLADMTMPFMTGFDLAKEILKVKPEMKIIICTGHSEIINHRELDEMGIAYTMKPILKSEIARLIRSTLGKGPD